MKNMKDAKNHNQFCFNIIYDLLKEKGPGRAESIDGTLYTIEAKIGGNNEKKFILGTTSNGGTVRLYDDWDNDEEYHQTRIGGICRGKYTIYDWCMHKIEDAIKRN
jgi:hypothetical protein